MDKTKKGRRRLSRGFGFRIRRSSPSLQRQVFGAVADEGKQDNNHQGSPRDRQARARSEVQSSYTLVYRGFAADMHWRGGPEAGFPGKHKEYGGSRPVSRILYPGSQPRAVVIHLGPPLPTASCGLPEPQALRATASAPTWPCSGRGLPSRPCHQDRWWALTPPFHPCPCPKWAVGGLPFCGTFRRVTPPGRYPAPCPVESGLSSGVSSTPATTRPAPSDLYYIRHRHTQKRSGWNDLSLLFSLPVQP